MNAHLKVNEVLPSPLAPQLQPASISVGKARIAIVHYWFVNRRGGERVVEAMASFPPS
jgi:hypothetical protein